MRALLREAGRSKVRCMTGRFLIGFGVAAVLMLPSRGGAEMPAGALRIFNSYIDAIEARLGEQHRSRDGFLAGEAADPQSEMRLRRGEAKSAPCAGAAGATFISGGRRASALRHSTSPPKSSG